MRAHINLTNGTVSADYPVRPVGFNQAVKALSGETVELSFFEDGTPVLQPAGTLLRVSVSTSPGGTLLAEQTTFTVPGDASGYYAGALSFNTENVIGLLLANPDRKSFAAVGEFAWKTPGAEDWSVSTTFSVSLVRQVDVASSPLALTSPHLWLKGEIQAGANITVTADDVAGTLTIESSCASEAELATEAGVRAAADTALQANINAEATARANADTTLQGHIDGKANTSHTHDASAIVSGTLDPARIPVLYDGIHITSSGALSALTSDQQNAITNGAIVTTTDGKRWCYTGSGSKTLQASYILLADLAPDWSTISGKPSTFPPSALPAPTTTVLGGVKRNTGNSGQFVSGIGSDGALLFATPAGGGGGGTIVRAAVTLQGTTSSDTPSTAPGPLYIYINDRGPTLLTVTYIVSGETGFNRVFTIGYTDPADGTTFIDISESGGPVSLATQLASYLYYDCATANNISFSYDYSQTLTLTTNYAGSNSSITATCDNPYVCSISGGGSGTDDIPASGQISTARLLGNVSGKIIRLISVWAASSGLGQFVTLVDDYDNANIVPPIPDTGGALVVQQPDNVTIDKFFGACRGNIKASFGSGVTGGSASIYIIAEIVAVPDSGTFLYYTCLGLSYVAVIADGSGGTYTTTIESNSTNCGYGS